MGRKRKYKSAAEKQRAWRIRTGIQKPKVSLEIREGERTGGSEALLREKREDETWDEYHLYLEKRVKRARAFKSEQIPIPGEGGGSVGAKRAKGRYAEPDMPEEYYEHRTVWEKIEAPKKMRDTRKKEI